MNVFVTEDKTQNMKPVGAEIPRRPRGAEMEDGDGLSVVLRSGSVTRGKSGLLPPGGCQRSVQTRRNMSASVSDDVTSP